MSQTLGQLLTNVIDQKYTKPINGIPASDMANDIASSTNSPIAPKANPEFTGSVSLGRKGDTVVGTNSNAIGYDTTASADYTHAEGYQTSATNYYSHAEGSFSTASGISSHAEGTYTTASGNQSHAEGVSTTASDYCAHAEGDHTIASDSGAHAEGYNTVASENYSHAEGSCNEATGFAAHVEGQNSNGTFTYDGTTYNYGAHGTASHAEGNKTSAIEEASHAEGDNTFAKGYYAHAEGSCTKALGSQSHTEGYGTIATTNSTHAEGYYATANGQMSHAEGCYTTASGYGSHTEGYQATASGYASHAEGYGTTASGAEAHAEGNATTASGDYSHAEGYGGSQTSAGVTYIGKAEGMAAHSEGYQCHAKSTNGYGAHAEGYRTRALQDSAHAEGSTTYANGSSAHAEGYKTQAWGTSSHAEGDSTTASGVYSHAEGEYTKAWGRSSHAEGEYTVASAQNAHTQGRYTIANYDQQTSSGQGNYSYKATNSTLSVTVTDDVPTWEPNKVYEKGDIVKFINNNTTSYYVAHDHVPAYYYPNTIIHMNTDGGGTQQWQPYTFSPDTDVSLIPEWSANQSYNKNDIIKVTIEGDANYFKAGVVNVPNYVPLTDPQFWHTQPLNTVYETSITKKYLETIGNAASELEQCSNARALDWNGNEYLMGDLYVGCNANSTGGTKIIAIPAPPSSDGTYTLQAIVADGIVTYNWV